MKGREKRGKDSQRKAVLAWMMFSFLVTTMLVAAHEAEEIHEEEAPPATKGWSAQTQSRIENLNQLNLKILAVVTAIATTLIVISINYEKKIQKIKKPLFLAIVLPIIAASLFLAGSTIYGNIISTTKGPVHWHADYEVWACNQKLDLVNPKGWSNRIGTSTFHEHGDDRIHIEGVVHSLEDVALGRYFTTIGGKLHHDALVYPTEQGTIFYTNGDTCPDGQSGTLKVYVNGKKITQPEKYVITQTPYVPPGDCIIVEFSSGDAETTDKLCASWAAKGWSYER